MRRNLLTLAIQVQRHGPDTVKAVAIPDHGPVEYRKTAVGFELRCQPAAAGKPEVLQVGEIK